MNKIKLKVASGDLINSNLLVGDNVEPVKKITKNSAFNFLTSYFEKNFSNKSVCDLFSGSGNLGIEALSRGFKSCDFVEKLPINTKIIKENLNNLNLLEKGDVHTKDALKYLVKSSTNYDIVFADPPYSMPTKHLLKNIVLLLKPNGIFIYFHQKNNELPLATNLEKITTRNFGKSSYSVFVKKSG